MAIIPVIPVCSCCKKHSTMVRLKGVLRNGKSAYACPVCDVPDEGPRSGNANIIDLSLRTHR